MKYTNKQLKAAVGKYILAYESESRVSPKGPHICKVSEIRYDDDDIEVCVETYSGTQHANFFFPHEVLAILTPQQLKYVKVINEE